MPNNNNNQREGATSNPAVGIAFEKAAQKYFLDKEGLDLKRPYSVDIALYPNMVKAHNFDLGDGNTLVECKAHTWTKGNNMPSAKMSVWNEAMYYFFLAPKTYRKIFFVQRSLNKEVFPLIEYYFHTHFNFIPKDVEFYEYDVDTGNCNKYNYQDVERIKNK
jgi:hypothetical protein